MRVNKIVFSAIALFVLTTATAFSVCAETVYGIRTDSSVANATVIGLVTFDSATPGTVTTVGPFTGVVAGHTVRSIDFRPSSGQLYAVSTNGTAGQLYTVNLTNAVLTPVGAGFTLAAPPIGFGSADNLVEIDFNPVVDLIRLATGANLNGQSNPVPNNYRLDPTTGGLTATDVAFNYVPGDPNGGLANMQIAAAAYANPAAGRTTLYAWDYSNDSVVRIGSIGGTPDSPNTGRLSTIFRPPTFVTSGGGIGMDVGPAGILYVTRDTSGVPGVMGFYSMNASTGAQTLIGNYPAGTFITDISAARITTAAGVTISGRLVVSGSTGDRSSGLTNATVILTDPSGNARTTTSGAGGSFAFDNVEVGRVYTLSVRSRAYTFPPQVISVMDSIAGINFTGTPNTSTR